MRVHTMTIVRALHAAMEAIDAHKEKLGSGLYCTLAQEMKLVAESMDEHEEATRRAFAMELMLDVPASVAAGNVYEFAEDPEFMSALVRSKGRELQTYDPAVAALMGHAWKIELAEAFLPYHNNDPCLLCSVRNGVLQLLRLRSSFLPQIVDHLTRKGLTPQMLCPFELNVEPVDGDDGRGPSAKQFLAYEPRLIRWLLGIGELEPWPRIVGGGSRPFFESELIANANRHGGDDPSINEPCTCPACWGVQIPTMGRSELFVNAPECNSGGCGGLVP